MLKILMPSILARLFWLVLLGFSSVTYAVDNQVGLWSKLTLTGHVNKNPDYLYLLNIENRSIDNFNDQLGKTEAALGYALSPAWSVWLGDEYFNAYTVSPTTQSNNAYAVLAWAKPRLPQQIGLEIKSRIEERQLFGTAGMNTRWREQITAGFPLPKTKTRFIASEEFFMLLNHPAWVSTNFLELNRTFLGFDKPLTHNTHLEIGYLDNVFWKASNTTTTINGNNLYVNIVFNTDD